MAPGENIGVVDPFLSFAHCAGGMLLLVLLALETKTEGDPADREE
jgi:hypothetical protein